MDLEAIKQELRHYLARQAGRSRIAELSDDASLLEAGVIDSAVMVGLIAFLEGCYGFQVPDDDMVPENFETLTAMARYVASRRERPPTS
jgi:acyl carrier protein